MSVSGIAHKDESCIQVIDPLQDVLIVFVRFSLKLLIEFDESVLPRVGQLYRRVRVGTIAVNHRHFSISYMNGDEQDENIRFLGGPSGGRGVLFRHPRLLYGGGMLTWEAMGGR